MTPPTPTYSWPLLNERCGAEVWIKHENHSPVGAFKLRGGLVYFEQLGKVPGVIAVAEAIPFIEITNYDVPRLYELKGEIVSRGVAAITGLSMPVFPKRRFQHGAARRAAFATLFPAQPSAGGAMQARP